VIPARTTCESTIANREAGAARKRSITFRSTSVIIAIPDHIPPKKAFMQMIPGARNSMYVPADAECPWAPTFLNSCP